MNVDTPSQPSAPVGAVGHIVLTRPQGENQNLKAAILQLSGPDWADAITQAPLLAFSAVNTDTLAAHLAAIGPDDWLIFVSPRAVSYAFAQHPELALAKAQFACVGKATRAALQQRGVARVWAPEQRFDSEGLLALLAGQPMQNRRVVIIRGMTGRTHLAKALTARGAKVAFCPVYQCHCQLLPDYLHQQPASSLLVVITAPMALECLAKQSDAQTLLELNLVVINQRTLEKARRLGFAGGIEVAGSPETSALARAVGRFLTPAA